MDFDLPVDQVSQEQEERRQSRNFLTHRVHWTKVVIFRSANNTARQKAPLTGRKQLPFRIHDVFPEHPGNFHVTGPFRAGGDRETGKASLFYNSGTEICHLFFPNFLQLFFWPFSYNPKTQKTSAFHVLQENHHTLQCNIDRKWPIQLRSVE